MSLNKKNILLFNHNYATQFIDVSNQYALLFNRDKYHIVVVYLTGTASTEVTQRTIADEVIYLNSSKDETHGLKITPIRQLKRICQQRFFEIVIAHRFKPTYIMLLVAQTVNIGHIFFVMHALETFKRRSRRITLKRLWKKNMILAGVSNAVRDEIKQSFGKNAPNPIITLYNHIDIDDTHKQLLTREQARHQLKIHDNTFLFATIGRLVKEKNQQRLIEAFEPIAKKYSQTKLIIMGDGKLLHELNMLVKARGLTEQVILTGFVEKGFTYMKGFDVFILPSVEEAFGRVLIEAMVADIPIIGGNAHGIPEVIGDTGTIIDPYNIPQMTESMLTALKADKQKVSLQIKAAANRVNALFSVEKFRNDFWEVLETNQGI